MEVSEAPSFKNIVSPVEEVGCRSSKLQQHACSLKTKQGFAHSRLQKQRFSFGNLKIPNLQTANTLVFLLNWKVLASQAPGFKHSDFPFEELGSPSRQVQRHLFPLGNKRIPKSKLQTQLFSCRQLRFSTPQASKTLVSHEKVKIPQAPSLNTCAFLRKWKFPKLQASKTHAFLRKS